MNPEDGAVGAVDLPADGEGLSADNHTDDAEGKARSVKASDEVPVHDLNVQRRLSLPRFVEDWQTSGRLSRFAERYALLVAWAVLIGVFGVLSPNIFLSSANFSSIFGSQAVLVVLTLGLLVPLTAGDYDLSIAAVLSLAAMETAALNVNLHWPLAAAIACALASGIVVGLVNGSLVGLTGLDPLIITLGTGTVVNGLVLLIGNAQSISGVDPVLSQYVVVDRLFGIPLEFYYGLAVAAVVWYVFEYTPVGRRLLFVGKSRQVSRLTGLHVGRLRLAAMATSGGVSALAGVMYVGTTGGADPISGQSLLLPAYAAAFLGAAAIRPGRYNAIGSLVAVYFLVTGITGLEILGAQSYVQYLFYGGALVCALALAELVRRRPIASLRARRGR